MEHFMKYLSNVATLQLDEEKCTGCRKCLDVCPHAVFLMRDKKASILDKDLCMECGACVINCEYDALQVNSGVGCASAIINSMIFGGEPSCDCSDDSSTCC